MNILYVDSVCYKPYSIDVMNREALGGSEASLLRVAKGLVDAGHDVSVYQHCADNIESTLVGGIRHVGLEASFPVPDVVVHFRSAKDIHVWQELFPSARHLMWTQDMADRWIQDGVDGQEVVCVSKFHADQFKAVSDHYGLVPKAISFVHNPLDVNCYRYPRHPKRLGFFSSPHKGLSQVIAAFQYLRAKDPSLELVVANPGYMTMPDKPSLEGVTWLGELDHLRVLEEMSRCEMLFYPQTVFAETFGIVLSEAEGLGTKVLAHDMGAAREVTGPHSRIIDCSEFVNVEEAFNALMASKDRPQPDKRFALSNIIQQWEALLEKEKLP